MNEELPPIRWPSAAKALAWAEETMARPDVQSATLTVMRSLSNIPGEGGSRWTRQDYRDLAATILTAWSGMSVPRFKHAIRAAQCLPDEDRIAWLIHELARHELGPGSGRNLRFFRVAVVRAISRHQMQRPLPRAEYSRALGLDRTTLYSSEWSRKIQSAENAIQGWIDAGEQDLAGELTRIGCMAGETTCA